MSEEILDVSFACWGQLNTAKSYALGISQRVFNTSLKSAASLGVPQVIFPLPWLYRCSESSAESKWGGGAEPDPAFT